MALQFLHKNFSNGKLLFLLFSTLRYADRARKIKNKPIVNKVPYVVHKSGEIFHDSVRKTKFPSCQNLFRAFLPVRIQNKGAYIFLDLSIFYIPVPYLLFCPF